MTHIDQHTQALETPPGGRPRVRPVSRRAALGLAVAVATVAGATVLGVATLGVDGKNEATGRSLAPGQDDSHTTQSSGQDEPGPPGGRAPGCWWTSKVNIPALPAEDLGGPPTEESVLIFENCNGAWTGNIAWLNPDVAPDTGPAASAAVSGWPGEDERFASCVAAETRSRVFSSSDDGLPNPWEAVSIAAKCDLSTDT